MTFNMTCSCYDPAVRDVITVTKVESVSEAFDKAEKKFRRKYKVSSKEPVHITGTERVDKPRP